MSIVCTPYKGKFIPQLVEYFLDDHVDDVKKELFFHSGDVVLDPFCGSGTTLVQANECGMDALGIELSAFNGMISNSKLLVLDIRALWQILQRLYGRLCVFHKTLSIDAFDRDVGLALQGYNQKFFPSPDYKRLVREGTIHEESYAREHVRDFLFLYQSLVAKHRLPAQHCDTDKGSFLRHWYLVSVRRSLMFLAAEIDTIDDGAMRMMAQIVLSRVARSCRATTHADLATLKEPQVLPYYCAKHGKICRPLLQIVSWWRRYSHDTCARLEAFSALRTKTHQYCLVGDARLFRFCCGIGTKRTRDVTSARGGASD